MSRHSAIGIEKRDRTGLSVVARWVLTAALVVLSVLAFQPAAWAHAQLATTEPAPESVVGEAPSAIRLIFTQPVRLLPDGVSVYDTTGSTVSSSQRLEDSVVVVDVEEALPDGAVLVEWRVVSEDGHVVAGAFNFYIGERTATPPTTVEPMGTSWPVVVANFFMYLGLLMAVGLAVFVGFVHDGGRDGQTLKRWLTLFAVVGWSGALAMILLRTMEATGGQLAGAGVPPGGLASVALVTFGAPLTTLGSWRGSRAMIIAGAALMLISLVVVGHTRYFEPVWMMMTSDLLHVAAGAVWVGGLAGLAAVTWGRRSKPGGSAPDPASASTMVMRFSSIAVWALAGVALTGLTMAWLTVPSWSSLFDTTYGRLVLTKIGIVLVLAAVAAVNRYRLKPKLQTSSGSQALSRLRITTTVECAALILLLGVAALLVEQDPAQGPGAPLGSQGPVQFALGDFTATLELEPGATGANQVGLLIRDETGSPIALNEPPALSLSQSESASGPLRYQLVEGGSGYTGEVTIPSAGIWQLIISARVDTFEQATAILRLDTSTRHISPVSGLIVSKARMPTPLVANAAVYMTLESDEEDRLVAATSPACHHTELHESVIDEFGVATMLLRPSILLTAGQPLALTSGSYHIMCEHADINLTVGDTTVFMVEMASGRRLQVHVDVVSYAELEGDLD